MATFTCRNDSSDKLLSTPVLGELSSVPGVCSGIKQALVRSD